MNDNHTLVTTAEFDTTPEKVWDAWTDPEKIAKWWGPNGFTSTVEELDVREGGKFRVIMHGPDGVDYPNTYEFDSVSPPSRLVYTNRGSERFGLAPFQSVFDIERVEDKTMLTLKMRFASEVEKEKHVHQFHADEGSRELLARLAAQAE